MGSFNILYFSGIFLFVLIVAGSCSCDSRLYVPPSGIIYSPKYPQPYDNNTNCLWHITSHEPGAVIALRIQDLDIEADGAEVCPHGRTQPCCKHNWLSVPESGAGKVKRQLCGSVTPDQPILVRGPATIKLHITKTDNPGRGFRLAYSLVESKECSTPGMVPCGPHAADGCYNNQTQRCDGILNCVTGLDEALCAACHPCASGHGCYTPQQKCDHVPDCHDYSDELDCGWCEKGKVLCSSASHQCFAPQSQRCNGRFDCAFGEDEVDCVRGCEDQIACSSGEGCYSSSQRCDSLTDCPDSSDERMCPREVCEAARVKRRCHNGHCLAAALWCDGTDDCGDNSDEAACLKNAELALAIIGCLFSGLVLVVAVGCGFRYYGYRHSSASNYHLHISPRLASRLRMSTSVSLPALVDDDFFHREPPPAYSVAVGECEVSLQAVPPTRPSRQRRQRLRPVPPPQVVIKPPEEASSSQSSPSRGSITSSSYLSGTDDTLLLST